MAALLAGNVHKGAGTGDGEEAKDGGAAGEMEANNGWVQGCDKAERLGQL